MQNGAEKKTIGYHDSEVLEFRPAKFVVLIPRREKVACPQCQAHVSIADDDMDVRLTAFLYAPNLAAEHPGELLADYAGHFQGDGYAGFDRMLEPPDAPQGPAVPSDRRLGCGMHIRRRFENAAKLGDARGAVGLAFFRKIYAVEEACKQEGLSHEQRRVRRETVSLPLAHEMYA